MKQFGCIFLFIISFSRSASGDLDVKHLIVDHKGNTTECFVDSIGYQFLYYIPIDSVDRDSMFIKDIYYAYNDFGKVFHYSWSFQENIRRMSERTGQLFTIDGDTIDFINIKFNDDMIDPEVFINTSVDRSEFISMFNIEKIETDYSIMYYSIKKGFHYSFYSFIIASTLNVTLNWDKERRAVPQIWDKYNDLFPSIKMIGMRDTGVMYQSFTSLIPFSVFISMIYDMYKDKNEFYFTPIFEEKKFGRNMYIFSFKNITKTYSRKIIYKVESTKFGNKVLGWIR
jgi:hypothetical protein